MGNITEIMQRFASKRFPSTGVYFVALNGQYTTQTRIKLG